MHQPETFSSVTSCEEEDTVSDRMKEMINTNYELKDTLRKIQKLFQIVKKFIDACDSTQVNYATYEIFALIENTPIDEFASIL